MAFEADIQTGDSSFFVVDNSYFPYIQIYGMYNSYELSQSVSRSDQKYTRQFDDISNELIVKRREN